MNKLNLLIEEVNILESHSMILFTIRDSKSSSYTMQKISELIDPDCEQELENKCRELYSLAESLDLSTLEEVIRKINPGFIRMNLRNIYKNKSKENK